MIYAGGGIINANAAPQLRELAEKLNAPVTNTLMGLGGFPGSHKQFVGMLGMHGSYTANKTMANADLIVALGARFDDRVTNNVSKFCPNAKILHVDIDKGTLNKIVNAHVTVQGSVDVVLEQMLQRLAEHDYQSDTRQNWWAQIDEWREFSKVKYEKSDEVIKPQAVIENLVQTDRW